jgi:transcription initiation factor TFIID subunit 6
MDLQLYFTRLTTALVPTTSAASQLPAPPTDQNSHLLPESERHRIAALASLREDTAISGLLVYLVKWLNESIGKCLTGSLGTLGCLVDAVEAVLDNSGIFLEPYVRQHTIERATD